MGASTLSVHNASHTISKMRPKIKIVHVIAPEIIKTDVENFRELVQRLTGKPDDRAALAVVQERRRAVTESTAVVQREEKIKCEVKLEEEEEEVARDDHHHEKGGFLSFLEDDQWLLQGMSDFLLPLSSTRVDSIGEMYAS